MYLLAYARSALANFARGSGITLPASWWVGLASGLDEFGEPEEIVDSNYFRVEVPRTLAAWSGTQGVGTTGVSTGSSHATSNNVEITWGSLSGSWGVATHVVLYDDYGEGWFAVPIDAIDLQSGAVVSLAPGSLQLVFGLTSGTSNYLANKLIDLVMRDEYWLWPETAYIGYTRTASTNALPGNEPGSGTGYARVAVDVDTPEWNHDDGTIANANTIEFPAPTLDQGAIVGHIYMDAPIGGNMLFHGPMNNGAVSVPASTESPSFQAGALEYYFS